MTNNENALVWGDSRTGNTITAAIEAMKAKKAADRARKEARAKLVAEKALDEAHAKSEKIWQERIADIDSAKAQRVYASRVAAAATIFVEGCIDRMSKAQSETQITINDRMMASHMVNKWVLGARAKRVTMQKFSITHVKKALRVTSGPYDMPQNLFCEYAREMGVAKQKVNFCGDFEVVNDFTKEFIAVEIDKLDDILQSNLTNCPLYVVDGYLCLEIKDRYESIGTICGRKTILKSQAREVRMFNYVCANDAQEWEAEDGLLDQTAGEKKHNTIIMAEVSTAEKRAWLKAFRNVASCGVTDITNSRNIEAEQKEAVPASNRKSQMMAPESHFGNISAYGLLVGKFHTPWGESMDGLTLINLIHFLMDVNELDPKFSLSADMLEGMAAQFRAYSLKCLGLVVGVDYLKMVIRHQCSNGCIVIQRDSVTPEIQKLYNDIWYNGKNHPWIGKMVVIVENAEQAALLKFDEDGNLANPEMLSFLSDKNGMKAPTALNMHSAWNVLSMSHTTTNIKVGATLSGQQLQTLLFADKEGAKRLVYELTGTELERTIMKDTSNEIRPLDAVLAANMGLSRAIADMSPELAGCSRFLPQRKRVVNKTIETALRAASESRYKVEGFYTKCIVDHAAWCGTRVLEVHKKYIECYNPLATKKGIRWGIGIKYPKAGVNEFVLIKYLTLDEYMDRVWKSKELSMLDKAAITNAIVHADGGLLVLPAYEELKDQLAGMDFDGDSIICVTDERIVRMFVKAESIAVRIDGDDNGRLSEKEYEAAVKKWQELLKKVDSNLVVTM